MGAGEVAAAVATLAVGIYLILASLGAVPLAVNFLLGLAAAIFGVSYAVVGRTREAAFWGGLLLIVGVALIYGGGASPLLVVGVVLVFASLVALLGLLRR